MNPYSRLLVPVVVFAVACAPAEKPADQAAAPAAAAAVTPEVPAAMFMAPARGDSAVPTDVHVSLMSHGITIEPAAAGVNPGRGHYHLFLDADPTPAGAPIPANTAQIQHLGDGSSEFTFKGVKAGAHRLIVVLADGAHVPIAGAMADTVNFKVK